MKEISTNPFTDQFRYSAQNQFLGLAIIILILGHNNAKSQCTTAAFQIQIDTLCSPAQICFLNASNNAVAFIWIFGDPSSGSLNTSNVVNPCHIFDAVGGDYASFDVILTAIDDTGCATQDTQVVTIKEHPDLIFTSSSNFVFCNGDTSFTLDVVLGSSTTSTDSLYKIFWGDNDSSIVNSIGPYAHDYSLWGYTYITVIAFGTNGCTDTVIHKLFNGSTPSIDFPNPGGLTNICAYPDPSSIVTFTLDGLCDDPPGTTYTYFTNLKSRILTIPQGICSYEFTDTFYQCSCGFSDGFGNTDAFFARVTATNDCDDASDGFGPIEVSSKPIAEISVNDSIACIGQEITLISFSTSCDVDMSCLGYGNPSWSILPSGWEIVSGSLISDQVNIKFNIVGVYSIMLVSSNGCGTSDTAFQTVCINDVPIASQVISDTVLCAPDTLRLYNTSSILSGCLNNINTTVWKISPSAGFTTILTNKDSAVYAFNSPGTYLASMILVNECGSDTMNKTVVVKSKAQVNLNPILNICTNDPVTLTPTAIFNTNGGVNTTYLWTSSAGFPSSYSSAICGSFYYDTTGITDTIIVEVTNECGVSSDTLYFSIHPQPIINPIADSTICKNDTITLSAVVDGGTPSYSFLWQPTTSLSNPSGASTQSFPANTTTYTLTITDIKGCIAKDTVIITIHPTPNIIASQTTPSICYGDSTDTISISGGSTYTWSPIFGVNSLNSNNSEVILNPTLSTSYLISSNDTNLCPGTTTISVTVVAMPILIPDPDTIILCLGSSAILTVSGATNYQWIPNDYIDSLGSAVIINPTGNTTYMVVGSILPGCLDTAYIPVFVDSTVVKATTTDSILCIGESTNLFASGNNLTWTWSPSDGLNTTVGQDVIAMPDTTTTYTVSGISTSNCLSLDSIEIKVNALPNIEITTSDYIICSGDTIILNATGTDSLISWPVTTYLTDSTGISIHAIPLDTIVYYATGLDTNSCSNTDSITIYVIPPPYVTAGPDTIVCDNSPMINLNYGTTLSGTFSGPGVNSFFNTFDPTIVGAGIYEIIFTYSDPSTGCSNTDTLLITVFPSAFTFTLNDTSVCYGSPSIFLPIGNNPAGGYFEGPGIVFGMSGYYFDPSTVNPGTYTISYHPYDHCYYVDQIIITVYPLPVLYSNPDSAVSICYGTSVELTVAGALTYTWSPTSSLNSSFGSTVIAEPNVTATYTVTGIDLNGCTSSKSISVLVVPQPEVDYIIVPVTMGCDPLTVFVSNLSTGANSFLYDWHDGTFGIENFHTYTSPGIYDVTVYAYFNSTCFDSLTQSQAITVNSRPKGEITYDSILSNCAIKLILRAEGLIDVDSTVWYIQGQTSINSKTDTIIKDEFKQFLVGLGIFNNECPDTIWKEITIHDDLCHPLIVPTAFTPNGDGLNDVFQVWIGNAATILFDLKVFNRWGELVFQSNDPGISWNGMYKGKQSEMGAYIYDVKVYFIDGSFENEKGSVTLIR